MVPLPPQPPQSAPQSTQVDNPPGDNVDDITLESQPPSGTSSDSSTIYVDTANGIQIEQLIWRTQPSPQCSPLVRTIPQSAEYISQGSRTSKERQEVLQLSLLLSFVSTVGPDVIVLLMLVYVSSRRLLGRSWVVCCWYFGLLVWRLSCPRCIMSWMYKKRYFGECELSTLRNVLDVREAQLYVLCPLVQPKSTGHHFAR
eukprot:5126879-Amphidinium_carterae.2